MIKSYKQMSWYKERQKSRKRDNLKKHIKSKRKRKAIKEGWKWQDFGRSIKALYMDDNNFNGTGMSRMEAMKNYKGL